MKKLIVLSGPTAAGKTELSLSLAERIGGEIVSADSMQVYRGMDIGTAKIRADEMRGIRHHLIDVISPFEEWSAGIFKEKAMEAMEGIYSRGHIPIITGGTGFYIQTVLYDIDFSLDEPHDEVIMARLLQALESEGPGGLHKMLAQADPEYALSVHANNVKRVMRALEYNMMTGRKMSEHNAQQRERRSAFNSAYFVLSMDRDALYKRIDSRVDAMLEQGLVDEVSSLMASGLSPGEHVSMQGLGYKEIARFLTGEISLQEAVRILKRDTRHFAKRQLTWFRREKDVIWIMREDHPDEEAILGYMLKALSDRGIAS